MSLVPGMASGYQSYSAAGSKVYSIVRSDLLIASLLNLQHPLLVTPPLSPPRVVLNQNQQVSGVGEANMHGPEAYQSALHSSQRMRHYGWSINSLIPRLDCWCPIPSCWSWLHHWHMVNKEHILLSMNFPPIDICCRDRVWLKATPT